MRPYFSVVSPEAKLGSGVRIYDFVNIYGAAEIGDEAVIGAFVEIQPGVIIGKRVKVSSHAFLCTGVRVEDDAFIGHGVMFINDRYPKSVNQDGTPTTAATTNVIPTLIKRGASVGTGATILCGVTVGENAMVGAGSVVVHDVPAGATVVGNPARIVRQS
jgi:acetyltransferase-like isoleucine patch superfamily enzyme